MSSLKPLTSSTHSTKQEIPIFNRSDSMEMIRNALNNMENENGDEKEDSSHNKSELNEKKTNVLEDENEKNKKSDSKKIKKTKRDGTKREKIDKDVSKNYGKDEKQLQNECFDKTKNSLTFSPDLLEFSSNSQFLKEEEYINHQFKRLLTFDQLEMQFYEVGSVKLSPVKLRKRFGKQRCVSVPQQRLAAAPQNFTNVSFFYVMEWHNVATIA